MLDCEVGNLASLYYLLNWDEQMMQRRLNSLRSVAEKDDEDKPAKKTTRRRSPKIPYKDRWKG
ncbi:MAG: hypothetical protein IIA48_09395 [Bacteroidetes bacterium]|nr:hypothetical protein [Bacteroidota bacterium]